MIEIGAEGDDAAGEHVLRSRIVYVNSAGEARVETQVQYEKRQAAYRLAERDYNIDRGKASSEGGKRMCPTSDSRKAIAIFCTTVIGALIAAVAFESENTNPSRVNLKYLRMANSNGYPPLAAAMYHGRPHAKFTDTILRHHFPSLDSEGPPDPPYSVLSLLGPGLHRARCWFDPKDGSRMKECFFMVVTEDPDDAASPLIAFPVVRFFEQNSPKASQNPVLHLGGGGPGYAMGLENPRLVWNQYRFLVKNTGRDLYVIDPRGVGMAHPRFHCFHYFQPAREAIRRAIEPLAELEIWHSIYRGCKEHILKNHHDLVNYNSSVVARDLDLLRGAIGAERFVLYGVSAGSRYALRMAQQFPDTIEAMVLDGASFTNPQSDGTAAGHWEAYFKRLFSYHGRGSRVLDGLIEKRFWKVVSELNQEPLLLRPLGLVLTGGRFLDVSFMGSYDSTFFHNFVKLIDELEERRIETLLPYAERYVDFLLDPLIGDPIYWSHYCLEMDDLEHTQHTWSSPSSLGERNKRIVDLVKLARAQRIGGCKIWGVPLANSHDSPGEIPIPTLFLQGALDPATPLDGLLAETERFHDYSLLVFEDESHWRSERADRCAMLSSRHFIEDKMLGTLAGACANISIITTDGD